MGNFNNQFTDQWRIRLESGQVKGPYSTTAINKMIVEGVYTGNEFVCAFPDGDWKPLSKQPEFYEALLESLENPNQRDEKISQKMEAETVIKNMNEDDDAEASTSDDSAINFNNASIAKPALIKKKSQLPATMPKNNQPDPHAALISARDKQFTIELSNIQKLKTLQLKKFFPHFLGLIVFFAGIFIYLNFEQDQKTGWVLIAPKVSAENKSLSAEELKSYKTKSFALLRTGLIENTRQAQKILVEAVEGSKNDLESIGLLCVVYQQLWPYTRQTTQDFKAVTVTTQLARGLNPISSYSDTCQSVYLLAKGQPQDYRGLIEKTLDQAADEKFILFPFLYVMKAELLEENLNFLNAEAYFSEATKIFPNWNWALFGQARSLYKLNKYNESRQIFEQVLNNNSENKAALFGMALNEIKLNSDFDKAYSYFNSGYALESKLPKTFHLEAIQEYIKILLSRNENSKALKVAQYGLSLSPSHRSLKETVIALGGNEKNMNATTSELILLGDQFARAGDHLAAQAQYQAAFDYDSKNGTVALKAAKSLWAINQTRGALLWVDKAIKAEPRMYGAYALKADYLSQKYNFIDASKVLIDANRKAGQNYDLLKTHALVEFRKNNMQGTITYGAKALKMYDADVELLTLLAQANINLYANSPSKNEQESALKDKYKEDSRKYASKAVDLEPGWPEAQITYTKYLKVSGAGSVAAENNIKKLIETFPYTYEYRIGLAEFYEEQEKFTAASEIYLQLIESNPKNKKALMGLARSYQYSNQPKLAQNYYLQAAALDPSDVEPLFATAQLELETATLKDPAVQIKRAFDKFRMVREVNPNFPRISYFMAKCKLELGEFDEAIQLVNEEKKKNPSLADPYILAAAVYTKKDQFKECAAEYSLAIKLRPANAALFVDAAICYRRSDAVDIASDMLEIAKTRENGYPPIYREMGYISERNGDTAEAIKQFRRYLDLSPNAGDRNQIEAKITGLGG